MAVLDTAVLAAGVGEKPVAAKRIPELDGLRGLAIEFNGLLIPPADASAIEQAILRLAGSVELRKRLGLAACASMPRYTWERAGRQPEALFRHMPAAEAQERRA